MARFLKQLAPAAFTFIALASTASAGINNWTSLGPEGGDVVDVAITKTTPAVAYALTHAALYRSNDMGQTWSQTARVGHGSTQDLAVHPTQPDRVAIMSGGQVVVSSDGGVTFHSRNPPAASVPLQRIEISEDGAYLYASDRNALYRSSDFGATWTTGATVGPPTNSYILPFHVDPANPDRVIARVEAGLSITDDAGAHWTPVFVPATFVADIAFDPAGARIWAATPEALWYTTDNGTNWILSTLTAGVSKVTIHPTNASIMYAHDGATLYRSTDAGATWTSHSGTLSPRLVNALAIDPNSSERLLIATLTGVWSSADAGATWSPSSQGLVGGTPWFLTSTPVRAYFSVRSQLFSLEWDASAPVALDSAALSEALSLDPPYDSDYIYEVHADRLPTGDRLFVGNDAHLARSLDGGQTWTRLSDPLVSERSIHAVDVAPGNPNIVLAGTYSGVLRSIDGGDTWSTTSGIPEMEWIDVITFVSADVAYASVPQGLYRTSDAGLSWSPVDLRFDTGEYIISVLAHAEATYIGTSLGAYQSTDAGLSWTRLSVSYGGRLAADATGLYIGGRGVSRSIDSGNTWTGIGFPGDSATGLELDPTSPGRLLLPVANGGVITYTLATDLTVTAAGMPSAVPVSGGRSEIWFTVTNSGPHIAAGVTLNIDVGGGRALFENAECSVNSSTPSHATCTLDPLPSGQSKLVRIFASFETAGPLSYTASVASVENELTAGNNSLSHSWTYNPPSNSGGGGGGGGTLSWWMLLALAGIAAERRRVIC